MFHRFMYSYGNVSVFIITVGGKKTAKVGNGKRGKGGKGDGSDGGGRAGGGGRGGKGGKKEKGEKGSKKLTKEEKQRLKAGKRDADSDSEYSYRSVVSAGGTRHVRRRRKREDGTYSDSASYHSSQDEDGEARRRQRRRDREHGPDSAHSYYSVVSEGGTRHVRRRKRHDDGTYSASEEYDSTRETTKDGSRDKDGDSDYSYASEVSEGGTRYETKRKRLRDADGNIIGYGEKETVEHLSDTESVRTKRGSIDGSFTKDRINIEDVLGPQGYDSGIDDSIQGKDGERLWPDSKLDRIPSGFSDATTIDDVDLSNMTEEEKAEYFKQKEKRRQEREARRRAKYGDKYDEIMKKREEKREQEQLTKEQEEREKEEKEKREQKEKDDKTSGRRSSNRKYSDAFGKGKEPPKSMVTYEKGPPREIGGKDTVDKREHGLPHDSWGKKDKTDLSGRRGSNESTEFMPTKLRRETTMLKKLPTIPQGKVADEDKKKKHPGMGDRDSTQYDGDDDDEFGRKRKKDIGRGESIVEMGADGKLRLKKKIIDLKDLDEETLRKLGIDPNLSAKEIAKKLKEMFGDDIKIKDGSFIIGTKHAKEFEGMDDDELAQQEDLDVSTLSGPRKINILMKRGGSALRRHMLRILAECRLQDTEFRRANIDEQGSIDFLAHYRLVDPQKVDGYAKAFVVEDTDYDTFINFKDTVSALDGIDAIRHMSSKQMDYVFRVLNIDEATRVTFRMFAVLTALCERVSTMDHLSRHLLEICNLLDIERKLDLYKAMFYHNIPSYRDTNYVTEESLKIELMAGGLNWSQQQFVMEKMEPNTSGEVSFLDYMCYIPLFLSMHDNICENPLDMSNQKYQAPPRRRPPSVQRDMNPLSQPLSKKSTFLMKKQATDFESGKANPDDFPKEYIETVHRYAKLPDIPTILQRQPSNISNASDYFSGNSVREKSMAF